MKMLKDFAIWFKGALIGFAVGLISSAGLFVESFGWLASPGFNSCTFLTSCSGDICRGCILIGLMFNLLYGFVIGAVIGWMIGKNKRENKSKVNNKIRKKK